MRDWGAFCRALSKGQSRTGSASKPAGSGGLDAKALLRSSKGRRAQREICTIAAHTPTYAYRGGRPTLGPTPGSSQRRATTSGWGAPRSASHAAPPPGFPRRCAPDPVNTPSLQVALRGPRGMREWAAVGVNGGGDFKKKMSPCRRGDTSRETGQQWWRTDHTASLGRQAHSGEPVSGSLAAGPCCKSSVSQMHSL